MKNNANLLLSIVMVVCAVAIFSSFKLLADGAISHSLALFIIPSAFVVLAICVVFSAYRSIKASKKSEDL
ncbi:hypothetical protein [Rothia aerolata]|uniref:Uncharacterized protein n=1 Tax=Rothia aerolata TaxID=1812262 RepID=A0A917IWX5_9MICC|nr:hypothetical protein [Rothia aerolata]GGH66320.1 hypothetical protein GCM10007359_20400 [Rothia aerolata]